MREPVPEASQNDSNQLYDGGHRLRLDLEVHCGGSQAKRCPRVARAARLDAPVPAAPEE